MTQEQLLRDALSELIQSAKPFATRASPEGKALIADIAWAQKVLRGEAR